MEVRAASVLPALCIALSCGRAGTGRPGETSPPDGQMGGTSGSAGTPGGHAGASGGDSGPGGAGQAAAGAGNSAAAGNSGQGGTSPDEPPWVPSQLVRTFAFDAMWLGDTDRSGVPSLLAWKSYGIDQDGSTTGKPLCLYSKMDEEYFSQGPNGEDNCLWLTFPFYQEATTATQTAAIHQGRSTILISLDGPAGTVRVGSPLETPPKLDGGDAWPVYSGAGGDGFQWESTLTDVSVQGKLIRARGPGPLTISVWSAETKLPLGVFDAFDLTLLGTLTDDGLRITDGTIAGAAKTDWIHFENHFCTPSQYPIGKPLYDLGPVGAPCDRASFGMGFTAVRVSLGTTQTVPWSCL